MSRYTGPKNKLSRQEGVDLGLKTSGTNAHASLLRRAKIRPGQHGQKMRRKMSDYGRQLREKQKVKRMYGIIENQFKRYYTSAAKRPGVTGEVLLTNLERRLDNVIYRLGMVPTRASARQLVRHGHVQINNKRVDIPSYQVTLGEVISLRGDAAKIPTVAKSLSEETTITPPWLERKATVGKVVSLPKREEIIEDIDEQLIVEYYSR